MKMEKTSPSRVKVLFVLLVVVVCLLVSVLTFEFIKIANLKATEKKLNTTIDALADEIHDYTMYGDYYQNSRDMYLQDQARNMGWTKAGTNQYRGK